MEVTKEISGKCQLLLREMEARFSKVTAYGECQGSGREREGRKEQGVSGKVKWCQIEGVRMPGRVEG